MIHIMKLQEKYFNYIKYGTKEYEIRLNDEKRKRIKKGDFIEFQKEPLLEEKIIIEVDNLIYYNNFKELFNNIKIDYLASTTSSKEQLLKDLEKFYPEKEQNEYGVVAIKLKKDNIINISKLNNIPLNNNIFIKLKNNYKNFDKWYNKLSNTNIFYTESDNKITSILILKINEFDSQQFLKKGNILKIRSFLVEDKNKGIGTKYLKLINDIALINNINYIYLTIKINNKELIKFIEKNNYQKYNILNDEYIYYKEI